MVFNRLSNSCKLFFLLQAQLCMQWKFGFRVINHWRFAPTYCRCTLEFYFILFLRKCRNYQYVFFSADEAGTKDAWQEALRRDHEENLLRPVRGRTGTFFLRKNSSKCWSGLIIITIPGHCWHHADNREDAQLWCEEHLGLQRGGGHQPGGGWAEGDGVRCLLFNLLKYHFFTKFWWCWSKMPSSF